jgi:hypothetical protein
MKRWLYTALWFATEFVWNLTTKPSPDPTAGPVYHCLAAIGQMTSPIEIIASIIAVALIWKGRRRKSLAERHRERLGVRADGDVD